jgi:hypothetical protein
VENIARRLRNGQAGRPGAARPPAWPISVKTGLPDLEVIPLAEADPHDGIWTVEPIAEEHQ